MNVTWVLGWPNGHERGEFLTTDLGGTNLRVCWIVLKERKGEIKVTQDSYKLPEELKTGQADELWSFMAESLGNFVEKYQLGGTPDNPLQLGFTFSYPAHQDFIDHGVLQTWTKGFDIKGVEGHDAATQLREALEKRVRIRKVPLFNILTLCTELANSSHCSNQRHDGCHDRLSVQRSGNYHRCHFRDGMQCGIYGRLWLHIQAR